MNASLSQKINAFLYLAWIYIFFMNWEQLLSLKRFGDQGKRLRAEQDETRLGFEVDYDRIIFSSEFRSLQDKTQVIPMSQTDFVHTRLTHSLEVSVVGRSLGRLVGAEIVMRYPHLEKVHQYKGNDFGAIVAAASLAHDIGNPPFGHSGEKAIGDFYETGLGKQFAAKLTATEYADLCLFEGNANGFRILNESRPGREGGLRLSYATLGAFTKYPKESLPKKPTRHIADKKYGFFQSEKTFFKEVAAELGLIDTSQNGEIRYARHPLTYLVEAADDICYTIIDFEDGINLGLIDESLALEYLIKLVDKSIQKGKYAMLKSTKDRLSYLRALAISTLINEARSIFLDNERAICDNKFKYSLLDKSQYKAQIADIINVSVSNIYNSDEVLEKEIAGHKAINELHNLLVPSVIKNSQERSAFDELIVSRIPELDFNNDQSVYTKLIGTSGYISLLSDQNAIKLYKNFNGFTTS